MADEKAVERVLSRILREGTCSRGRLMNYCAVGKYLLEEITAELEKQGKIKSWPRGRKAIYTPPDGADPWAASDSPSKNEEKPEARKAETPKARKTATPRVAPATAVVAKAPSNGSGSFAAAIAELEAKRDKIDQAIEALRAIA